MPTFHAMRYFYPRSQMIIAVSQCVLLLLGSLPATSASASAGVVGFQESALVSRNSLGLAEVRYLRSETCTPASQLEIFRSSIKCEPRPAVVELPIPENRGENAILQLIPGHVMVDRCSGSCATPSQSCLPTRTENISLQVMAIQTTFQTGHWNTMCAEVRVERHLECGCGCAVQAHHCDARLHSYDRASCRCRCRAEDERNKCVTSGKFWNSETCACVCPERTWTPCSTGYVFDYQRTCRCVNTTMDASTGLTALFAVFGVLCVAVSALVFQLRRRQELLVRRRTLADIMTNEAAAPDESVR